MANHPGRIVWYAILNWILLFALFGITASIPTVAKTNLVPLVLILAHLGVVPMLTHHFLRRFEGDRMKGAWQAGIAFGIIGLALDYLTYGYYLEQGTSIFSAWTTWAYLALRIFLAPITARWLDPQNLNSPSSPIKS